MAFIDLANKRESVRNYLNKPVSRDRVDRCVEAARLAPSACNSQPWKFIIIDDQDLRRQVAESAYSALVGLNRFVQEAPVLVTITAEKSKLSAQLGGFLKKKPYYLLDIGMAVEHFCLQAVEENLGTCIIGWFNEKAVRKLLGIPSSIRVPLIITVGYPDTGEARDKKRKPLDEIRTFNRY